MKIKPMHLLVLNRDSIKTYATPKKHALIQIYCHDDYPEPLNDLDTRIDTLKVSFDDWNAEQKLEIERDFQHSAQAKKFIYFSEEHAKQIIDFIKKYIDNIELIIVQCDAGISRSAGVAAALSKCLNGDDEYFFKRYLPNSLVYSTIMKEWNKNE